MSAHIIERSGGTAMYGTFTNCIISHHHPSNCHTYMHAHFLDGKKSHNGKAAEQGQHQCTLKRTLPGSSNCMMHIAPWRTTQDQPLEKPSHVLHGALPEHSRNMQWRRGGCTYSRQGKGYQELLTKRAMNESQCGSRS